MRAIGVVVLLQLVVVIMAWALYRGSINDDDDDDEADGGTGGCDLGNNPLDVKTMVPFVFVPSMGVFSSTVGVGLVFSFSASFGVVLPGMDDEDDDNGNGLCTTPHEDDADDDDAEG